MATNETPAGSPEAPPPKRALRAHQLAGTVVVGLGSWFLCDWLFYPLTAATFLPVIGALGLAGGWVGGRVGSRLARKS